MRLVYSYIRFSSKKQEQGDSLRRQVEGRDEWISRHAYTLVNLTLHDLGVSAFRGKNRHSGALRKFLAAVEKGQVKPGSILLIENLDRLSRQGVDEAYDLFKAILKAGIDIAVLKPYEVIYTRQSLNDFVGLLIPLLYFHLAHIESKNKSDRLRKAWGHKREDAAAGKKFGRRRPSWLDWDEARQEFVLNAGAEAVRFIFTQTAQGRGQRRLIGLLQKQFAPIGTSKRWNTSFLQAVLNDRAVLGELQPCEFDNEGRRIPVGEPIPSYYPAVIDEPLWYRAQAAKANNYKAKGANGDFINLFKGLVFNATDGSKMQLQTCRSGKADEYRRLISSDYNNKAAGADGVGVPYIEFEDLLLAFLDEVKAEDVQPCDNGVALADKEKELAGVQQRLDALAEALADESADTPVPVLASAAQKLTAKKAALVAEVEKLKEERHAERPLAQTQSVIRMLAAVKGEALKDLRLRLRAMIADLVESIYVKAERVGHRKQWLVQVNFKNGRFRQINHYRVRGEGGVDSGPVAQLPDDHLRPDLRDRDAAKALHFNLADVGEASPPPAIPAELPKELAAAAQVWLGVARQAMTKESFRVVPSKIRRFVDFIGADAHAADVDGPTWRRWVRFLKGQIADKELAQHTARVAYGRSREFVRWLVKNKLTKDFDELEPAGTEAIG